jgi:hypothetical protein
MKISYEANKLTIGDVSWTLFKRIIQAIEEHEAESERDEKAEQWRALAKEAEPAGLGEAA